MGNGHEQNPQKTCLIAIYDYRLPSHFCLRCLTFKGFSRIESIRPHAKIEPTENMLREIEIRRDKMEQYSLFPEIK